MLTIFFNSKEEINMNHKVLRYLIRIFAPDHNLHRNPTKNGVEIKREVKDETAVAEMRQKVEEL